MALTKHQFVVYIVTTTGLVFELRAIHWETQKTGLLITRAFCRFGVRNGTAREAPLSIWDLYPQGPPVSGCVFPEIGDIQAVSSLSFCCNGSSITPLSTEFLSNAIICVRLHLKCFPWDANGFCSPLCAVDWIPEDEGGQWTIGNVS